jgi:uncharacterized protein
MSIDGQSDETIRAILTATRRIAVVGASDKAWRPSHGVFGFLLSRGYDAVPVNPLLAGRAIHGRTALASVVWMQLGVVDEAAAARAQAAGIVVVMDRCPVIEVRRLGLSRH